MTVSRLGFTRLKRGVIPGEISLIVSENLSGCLNGPDLFDTSAFAFIPYVGVTAHLGIVIEERRERLEFHGFSLVLHL